MRFPSTSSSSIFPSWITTMTIGSLFISLFGISLFSVVLLGTQNVDVLTLLTMSEGMPNPMESFQIIAAMYSKCTSWIPSLTIPSSEVPVVELLTWIANLLLKLVTGLFYVVSIIPVLTFTIVFLPLYCGAWLIDTTGVLLSAINGTAWTPLSFSWLLELIG